MMGAPISSILLTGRERREQDYIGEMIKRKERELGNLLE